MRSARVSFVIPTYNRSDLLAEAINSALSQNMRGVEVVVVDDGSTDTTQQLLAWFKRTHPGKLTVHRNPKNQGSSVARNTGTRIASAPIVCYLDSDDFSFTNRARDTLAEFRRHPDGHVFYGQCNVANPIGEIVGSLPEPRPFDLKAVLGGADHFIAMPTVALDRKTALKFPFEGGIYQKNGIEDWKLWIDLGLAGKKFFFTRKGLSAYRYSQSGLAQGRDEGAALKAKQAYLKKVAPK